MKSKSYTANLRAAFGSFTFIPAPFVFSSNNFNPLLVLHDEHIEYRGGFIKKQLSYKNIKEIDVNFFFNWSNSLIISKKNGLSTFRANFRDRTQLQEFLKLFKSKGCHLSPKAELEISR